jgi:hypothetical protein
MSSIVNFVSGVRFNYLFKKIQASIEKLHPKTVSDEKIEKILGRIKELDQSLVKRDPLKRSTQDQVLTCELRKKVEKMEESEFKKTILNQISSSPTADLPRDILCLVLDHFDVQDVLLLRTINKQFCSVIDEKFAPSERFLTKKLDFLSHQQRALIKKIEAVHENLKAADAELSDVLENHPVYKIRSELVEQEEQIRLELYYLWETGKKIDPSLISKEDKAARIEAKKELQQQYDQISAELKITNVIFESLLTNDFKDLYQEVLSLKQQSKELEKAIGSSRNNYAIAVDELKKCPKSTLKDRL